MRWQILHRPDLAGRLTKWPIEMSEFDVAYKSRKALKAQQLTDFIVEITTGELKLTHS